MKRIASLAAVSAFALSLGACKTMDEENLQDTAVGAGIGAAVGAGAAAVTGNDVATGAVVGGGVGAAAGAAEGEYYNVGEENDDDYDPRDDND